MNKSDDRIDLDPKTWGPYQQRASICNCVNKSTLFTKIVCEGPRSIPNP